MGFSIAGTHKLSSKMDPTQRDSDLGPKLLFKCTNVLHLCYVIYKFPVSSLTLSLYFIYIAL